MYCTNDCTNDGVQQTVYKLKRSLSLVTDYLGQRHLILKATKINEGLENCFDLHQLVYKLLQQ